jgi:hypothetical protein
VAPGDSRVVPIVVERGGRTLRLYRVSQAGRFVANVGRQRRSRRRAYRSTG